ncbi:MAG TPA: cadherin-like domain-containing protein [Trichocoleus sp.]|jgi:hypothetical protein
MVKDAGNTLKSARRISILDTARSTKEQIGAGDPRDFFRVKLGQRSSLTLSLTELNANANLTLLSKTGKVLAQSRRSGKQSESIATPLDAGVYYIQVSPGSRRDSTRYKLTYSASNTAPSLLNTGLAVRPGTTATISSSVLKATDAEQQTGELFYTLTSLPQGGTLQLNGVTLGVGSQFTQIDVDSGRLSYTSLGRIDQLTRNATVDASPKVDGFNVVWSGNDDTDSEVFFYNGTTRAIPVQLTNNSIDDLANEISGTNVTWTTIDTTNISLQAFLYNTTTQASTRITAGLVVSGLPGLNLTVDVASGVSGSNVALNVFDSINLQVAQDYVAGRITIDEFIARGFETEVFLYNGSTGTSTRLTNNATNDTAVGISGSNIVWTGFDGNDNEVFFYSGTTGTTTQLTNNTTNDTAVGISGSNIVWTGFDGNDNEVFFYSGTTGTIAQLTNNATNDTAAGVSGLNVIWTGFDDSDDEVFFYDGTLRSTSQLTNNTTSDLASGISGFNVAWAGLDGSDGDIFFRNFSSSDSFSFMVTDNVGGITSGTFNLTIA